MNEIELKFLDIDVQDIKNRLNKLGAKIKFDTVIESYSFLAKGFDSWNSNKKLLRVRKINNQVTITYKDPAKESDMTSREEIECNVDNHENAILLLEKIGFKCDNVFKKHRIHYELEDIHFELDTLDNIPTYLEIETTTEDAMVDICKKLELDISDGKKGTIVEIFPDLLKTK